MIKRILLLSVLAAVMIGMVVIGGASAGSAATLYGPRWGRFVPRLRQGFTGLACHGYSRFAGETFLLIGV